MVLAEGVLWLMPCMLVAGWFACGYGTRKVMAQAAVAGLLGLACNQAIILGWPQPRPFMVGIGHTYLAHAADASFPSDHLTLWWSVALTMAVQKPTRTVGLVLVLAGVPIAWARVYLGVHFPLDMLGAFVVAAASAWLCVLSQRMWVDPLTKFMTRCYAIVFGPFIRRRWLKP